MASIDEEISALETELGQPSAQADAAASVSPVSDDEIASLEAEIAAAPAVSPGEIEVPESVSPAPGPIEVVSPAPVDPRGQWMLEASADIKRRDAYKALKISEATGQDIDFVADNLQHMERLAQQRNVDWAAFKDTSPVFAEWVKEHPNHAAAFQHSFDKMNVLEQAIAYAGNKANIGGATYEKLRLLEKERLGLATEKDLSRIDELRQYLSDRPAYKDPSLIAEIAGAVAEQTTGVRRYMLEQGAQAAIAGATLGAIGAATPLGPITVGAGAVAGFASGSIYAGQKMEALLAWDDMRQNPDIDPDTALWASEAAGYLNAGLESVGALATGIAASPLASGVRSAIKSAVTKNPVARKNLVALGREAAKRLREAAAEDTGKKIIIRQVGRVAVASVAEAGTEAVQEHNTHFAEKAAELQSAGLVDFTSPSSIIENAPLIKDRVYTDELSEKMRGAAREGALATLGFSTTGNVSAAYRARKRAVANRQIAKAHADALRAGRDAIAGIEETRTLPEVAESVAKRMDEEGLMTHFDAAKFAEVVKGVSENANVGDVIERLGGSSVEGTISFPMVNLMTRLGSDEAMANALFQHAKAEPNGMSEAEAAEAIEASTARLEELKSAGEEVGGPESDSLSSILRDADEADEFAMLDTAEGLADGDAVAASELQSELDALDADRRTNLDTALDRIAQRKIEQDSLVEVEQQLEQVARQEISSEPARLLIGRIQAGSLPRIKKSSLIKLIGKEGLSRLPRRPVIYATGRGAMNIDDVAEAHGFESPQALADALVGIEDIEVAVAKRVQSEMADIGTVELTPTQLRDEVARGRYGDGSRRVLSKQLTMVNNRIKELGKVLPTNDELRRDAKEFVDGLTFRQANPKTMMAAMKRYGRLAREAYTSGDLSATVDMKVRELEAHEMYLAARDAADLLPRVRRLGAQIMNPNSEVRKRLNRAPGHADAAINLLSRYDTRINPGPSATVKSDTGAGVVVGEQSEADPVHIVDASVFEVRDLHEKLSALTKSAEIIADGIDEGREVTHSAAIAEMTQSVLENNKIRKPSDREGTSVLGSVKNRIKSIYAAHLKVERIAEWLDGDKAFGAVWRNVVQPIMDAQSRKNELTNQNARKIEELYNLYSSKERNAWYREEFFVEELGIRMKKPHLLSLLLNAPSNMDVLTNGSRKGWTREKILSVLSNPKYFSETDAKFAKGMLDHINSFWEPSRQLHIKTRGIDPVKVESETITVAGVEISGYYPIAKKKASVRTNSLVGQGLEIAGESAKKAIGYQPTGAFDPNSDIFQDAYGAHAVTDQGRLKERARKNRLEVDLSLSVAERHLSEVTHDLAFREAVLNVDALVRDERFQKAVAVTGGDEMLAQIRPWLSAVARDRRGDYVNELDHWLSGFRSAATTFMLGFKQTVALLQLADAPRGAALIGSSWMMSGVKDVYAGNVMANWREISEQSSMMASRIGTGAAFRDMHDQLAAMNLPGGDVDSGRLALYRARMRRVANASHKITGYTDFAVATAIWKGAYNKSIAGAEANTEGGNHDQAVAFADRTVRLALGSGLTQDLSGVQRGPQAYQLLTMFYTFGSAMFQQMDMLRSSTVRSARAALSGDFGESARRGQAAVVQAMFFVMIPAALEMLVRDEYTGDDEEDAVRLASKMVEMPMSSIIGFRDIVSNAKFSKFGGPSLPAMSYLSDSLRGASTMIDLGMSFAIDPADEFDDKLEGALKKNNIKNIAAFLSLMAGGLPGDQISKETRFILDALDVTDEPEPIRGSWLEWFNQGVGGR